MKTSALLGFGTATFLPQYGLGGNTPATKDLSSLIRQAVEDGIQYVDTAADYGDSEQALGELSDLLNGHRVRVCTKLSSEALAGGIATSFQRLRCKSLDTLLLHSATISELTNQIVVDSLIDAKRTFSIRRIGASTYGLLDARLALEQPWCDVVQVEHNILNPSVVPALARIKRPGQEIVVRSVLCKGLLSDRRTYVGKLVEDASTTLDRLEAKAKEWEYGLPELAIRFALDTPGVDIVLVGISTPYELETALTAMRRAPLEPWQMDALTAFNCSSRDWTHPERWTVPV